MLKFESLKQGIYMLKVLICDDEAIIREGIKSLYNWESLGFSVCGEAANGDQAFNRIKELNPDIVLMDIRMPGKTGLEVIKEAKENLGFVGKIIIISGYSDFKYAQTAISYGVNQYITKPIDEDELEEILIKLKSDIEKEQALTKESAHYQEKAYGEIIQDILKGNEVSEYKDFIQNNLNENIYQVVIYEKYSHSNEDTGYSFSDMIRVTNEDHRTFDNVIMDKNEILLLKGDFSIKKFNDFLNKYNQELAPEPGSPLDSIFITYGRCVNNIKEIPESYKEALELLKRRFFCDNKQHTIGYEALPALKNTKEILNDKLLKDYSSLLLNYVQSYNRNMVAETLSALDKELYNASDSISDIKFFLSDLFIQIKEAMQHIYNNVDMPIVSNAQAIKFIDERFYLYEIILFFTEQFEIMMASTGSSNRDSILDDLLYYIDHNYANNITLENIAPLFGYNSSYLGKIFTKKLGESFNSYVDKVRIENSKKLLLQEDMKVYSVAEKVGYKNVDYFHIKFKKYVGQSPAEYRKGLLKNSN